MNLRQAQRIIDKITDDRLVAFVHWCRLNDERLTDDPLLVRGVLAAYMAEPKGTD